jgi:hypothetical protein
VKVGSGGRGCRPSPFRQFFSAKCSLINAVGELPHVSAICELDLRTSGDPGYERCLPSVSSARAQVPGTGGNRRSEYLSEGVTRALLP